MFSVTVQDIKELFKAWAKTMSDNCNSLIELDGAAGDSDLGLTMTDGFKAAMEYAKEFEGDDMGVLLYNSGKAIMTTAPSSLGTLIGSGFMEAGKMFKGKKQIEGNSIYLLFMAMQDSIMKCGGAKVGDKTFIDGLNPAVSVLMEYDGVAAPNKVLSEAAAAARAGANDTANMVARHGRMAIRGEASLGLIDPGAVVAALMIETFAHTLIKL